MPIKISTQGQKATKVSSAKIQHEHQWDTLCIFSQICTVSARCNMPSLMIRCLKLNVIITAFLLLSISSSLSLSLLSLLSSPSAVMRLYKYCRRCNTNDCLCLRSHHTYRCIVVHCQFCIHFKFHYQNNSRNFVHLMPIFVPFHLTAKMSLL